MRENNLCVVDVLEKLVNTGAYIDVDTFEGYRRIGLKSEESECRFRKSWVCPVKINNLTFNSKRANVSILVTYRGYVELDKKESERVGLDKIFKNSIVKSRVYRNYAVIRDGKLNIKDLVVYIDKCMIKELKDILGQSKVKVNRYEVIQRDTYTYYKTRISLEGLEVMNTSEQLNERMEYILRNVRKVCKLKAERKVIKKFISNLGDKSKRGKFIKFNEEQIEVLKENGLNHRLEYVGIGVRKESIEGNDNVGYYNAKTMEFKLRGASSIPSVNSVVKAVKEGKKMNFYRKVMWDYINRLKRVRGTRVERLAYLRGLLDGVQTQITEIETRLNGVKLAVMLDGRLWDSLEEGDKGEMDYRGKEGKITVEFGLERVPFSKQ